MSDFKVKKSLIKAAFKAVENGNSVALDEFLGLGEGAIHAVNFAPPAKDDGQSLLQKAIKCGRINVACHLIQRGAQVNFIELSVLNEWRSPVFHDAITLSVSSTLPYSQDSSKFNEAIDLIKLMKSKGADIALCDSYGNSCLYRALLDSRRAFKSPRAIKCGAELLLQIKSLFNLLLEFGCDPNTVNGLKPSARVAVISLEMEQYNLF
jgi:ankyrin repeat protein